MPAYYQRYVKHQLQSPLKKHYSALSGKLEELSNRIVRIKNDIDELPELEAELVEIGQLIDAAGLLLKDADPN